MSIETPIPSKTPVEEDTSFVDLAEGTLGTNCERNETFKSNESETAKPDSKIELDETRRVDNSRAEEIRQSLLTRAETFESKPIATPESSPADIEDHESDAISAKASDILKGIKLDKYYSADTLEAVQSGDPVLISEALRGAVMQEPTVDLTSRQKVTNVGVGAAAIGVTGGVIAAAFLASPIGVPLILGSGLVAAGSVGIRGVMKIFHFMREKRNKKNYNRYIGKPDWYQIQ